jgi:hypothetical protein
MVKTRVGLRKLTLINGDRIGSILKTEISPVPETVWQERMCVQQAPDAVSILVR